MSRQPFRLFGRVLQLGLFSVVCISSISCGGGASTGSTASNPTTNPTSNQSNPVPVLSSISPNSTIAGGPTFTLMVSGSGFVSSSVVEWNSSALPTAFTSSTELQAHVPALDIVSAGNASITVSTPSPGGGSSSVQVFTITPAEPGITIILNQPANDIVWDAVHQVIYASVPV